MDEPVEAMLRDAFSGLVFAQHVKVALMRFDGQVQRLRFTLGDEGLVPCPEVATPVKNVRRSSIVAPIVVRPSDDDEEERPSKRKSKRKSRREDEDEEDDRKESRVGFKCPYCASRAMPVRHEKISGAGWAVMVIMIIFCFPLFFIGLLMKEDYRACGQCGMKLG